MPALAIPTGSMEALWAALRFAAHISTFRFQGRLRRKRPMGLNAQGQRFRWRSPGGPFRQHAALEPPVALHGESLAIHWNTA